MSRFPLESLVWTSVLFLLPAAAQTTSATATTFTANLDGYQVPLGSTVDNLAVNKATAAFKIFLYSPTQMRFDFTATYPSNYTLNTITIYRGSPGSLVYPNFYSTPQAVVAYPLCGGGTYIRARVTCSPNGYVNNNGGDLQGSDLAWDPLNTTGGFPQGDATANITNFLDLLRHNLIFIEAQFTVATGNAVLGTRVVTIRGTPAPVTTP